MPLIYLVNDATRVVLLLGVLGGLVGWFGASYSAWQGDVKQQADDRFRVLNDRRAYLADLRERYIAELGDGIPQMLFARQAWPPDDWMNSEIAKDGLKFVFHGDGPRFTMTE